ncbi:MAG: hypothetical protein ACRCZA_08070 [Shewanella sp.]|uniref:hypothetical protein n=1 Tax=Shewanella sp. TaxID=50422 RepID=UPI003F35AC43
MSKNVKDQRERDRKMGVRYFRVRCTGTEFNVLKAVVDKGGFASNGDAVVSLMYDKAAELDINVIKPDAEGVGRHFRMTCTDAQLALIARVVAAGGYESNRDAVMSLLTARAEELGLGGVS